MTFKEDMDDGDQLRLVRVKEAAKIIGVSMRTVWRMLASGQLKAVRIRRCTMVRLSELLSWMKTGKPLSVL